MRWSEIPSEAKAYMLYHTLISPGLIVWILFPLYLMETGYSILEVGAFFTAVNLVSIPLTYIFGRAFNRWDIKKGLIATDVLDGIAYVLYGLAKGTMAPLMLFAGRTIEKLSEILYPLYRAYEQIIYPEDKYEEIFAWHLRLPEVSRVLTFPLMGYVLGYLYPGPESYRWAFILFGLFSAFTVAYIRLFLPSVGREERLTPEGFTFRAGEFKILIAFETLFTLAWMLAPEIVLINYIVSVLHKTVFEVTLVAVASSLASILGTYASERFPKGKGFQGMSLGMLINALYSVLMMVSPPFWLVIIAYSLDAFGGTFWFPFYRSWMFKLIPKERASEFHAAISSYRKVIGLFTPFIAGALASVHATLPYAFSLAFFLSAGLLLAATPRRLLPRRSRS
ncbi:MFS transporter [Thermococcus sp.]|uniref:MFS transporter n=1 Tax=Thermococcus sp. TaxID=35749 RepID=UPI0026320024|nr:MFS transporter [Thermococcus sp.]